MQYNTSAHFGRADKHKFFLEQPIHPLSSLLKGNETVGEIWTNGFLPLTNLQGEETDYLMRDTLTISPNGKKTRATEIMNKNHMSPLLHASIQLDKDERPILETADISDLVDDSVLKTLGYKADEGDAQTVSFQFKRRFSDFPAEGRRLQLSV